MFVKCYKLTIHNPTTQPLRYWRPLEEVKSSLHRSSFCHMHKYPECQLANEVTWRLSSSFTQGDLVWLYNPYKKEGISLILARNPWSVHVSPTLCIAFSRVPGLSLKFLITASYDITAEARLFRLGGPLKID